MIDKETEKQNIKQNLEIYLKGHRLTSKGVGLDLDLSDTLQDVEPFSDKVKQKLVKIG